MGPGRPGPGRPGAGRAGAGRPGAGRAISLAPPVFFGLEAGCGAAGGFALAGGAAGGGAVTSVAGSAGVGAASAARAAFSISGPAVVGAGRSLSLDTIEHGLLRRSRPKLGLGYLPNPLAGRFERSHRRTKLLGAEPSDFGDNERLWKRGPIAAAL